MDDLIRSAVNYLLDTGKEDEADAVTMLVEIIADLRQPAQPRATFVKADRGYELSVLQALQNVDISVGKACQLLRDFIATGTEGALPSHVCGTPDAMCDADCMGRSAPEPRDDVQRLEYVTHRLVRAEAALIAFGAKSMDTDYFKQFDPYVPGEPIPPTKDGQHE
jgi:hypothetical protein